LQNNYILIIFAIQKLKIIKIMIYFKPNQVTSPQKFMKIVRVIFDGGLYSFSIAELEWNPTKNDLDQ
jgi:predicted SnoaL-like aldol condensation-catalyzing enzyme